MFDKVKEEKGVEFDTDLTADDLKEVVEIYKEEYKKHAGVDFPQDPKVQMMEGGLIYVLLGVIFWLFRNEKKKLVVGFCIFDIILFG